MIMTYVLETHVIHFLVHAHILQSLILLFLVMTIIYVLSMMFVPLMDVKELKLVVMTITHVQMIVVILFLAV